MHLKKNCRSVSVAIPEKLLQKIDEKMKNKGFSSLSDYVVSLLEKDLLKIEDEEVFSEKDEEKIKEHLRKLGYI